MRAIFQGGFKEEIMKKKLSEIKTGEKFAFGGRFFMGVEVDNCRDGTFTMPISLETGKYGLDGEGGCPDLHTLVTPVSWESFKMTVNGDEINEHPIQGMMLTVPPGMTITPLQDITPDEVEKVRQKFKEMHTGPGYLDIKFKGDELVGAKYLDPYSIDLVEPEPPEIERVVEGWPRLRDFFEIHCETICNPFWWYLAIFVVVISITLVCRL